MHNADHAFRLATVAAAAIVAMSSAHGDAGAHGLADEAVKLRKLDNGRYLVAQATTRGGVWTRGVIVPPPAGRPRPGGSGRVNTNPGARRPGAIVPRDTGGGSGRFTIDRGRITSSSGETTKRRGKTSSKRRRVSLCGPRPRRNRNSKSYRRWLACKGGKTAVRQAAPRLPAAPVRQIDMPPIPIQRAVAMELDSDRRPDEIVALVGSRVVAETLAGALNLQLLQSRRSDLLDGEIARLRIADGRTVPSVVAAASGQPDVRMVAPNHIYGLQSGSKSENYSVKLIRYTEIGKPRTGRGVRIGIIDTALEKDHPALSGLSIRSFDAMANAPVAQTRHGTAIAGLIGGRKAVTGLAPGASIFAARAFDGPNPESVTSDAHTLIAALDWLAVNRVQLVNLSFAGPPNVLLRTALSNAREKGIVLVAAAGNGGPRARPYYPGAYPSTVAVTATDENREVYAQANRGDYVFVAAPGVDLLVPANDSGYDVMSGTSFAAAIVTGLAALHVETAARNAINIESALRSSTRDLGPKGRDRIFGFGLIDATRLIRR